MGAHVEIVAPRYVVLTRLADSWIPRAAHADAERAEREAFRWRRIYGPGRTRVAEYWIPEQPAQTVTEAILDVPASPVSGHGVRSACDCPSWRETALRAFALYLGFTLANRAMELLILAG
ncbi:MAG TPA: hypothetical protein VKZ87_01295 [Ferrovibrio sp.]|uniref:hypothetical protein n=1 Tax=Ferrovibrio sp. TaxID=1917215 RepID=UPI002B4ACAE7|nr:hypothetical protein [Ferrovibrio sp.]HLT75993.1 hypothetical protein [Ferrovibrio sp.]